MARSLNKVMLIGNLANDPDLRFTNNGTAVCNFRIITNETYKDNEGNWVEKAEGHNIVVWSKLAEICGEHLKKGHQVYIEGSLQTRTYDKDGVTRYITEVKAREMLMLARPRPDGEGGSYQQRTAAPAVAPVDDFDTFTPDDDLPF